MIQLILNYDGCLGAKDTYSSLATQIHVRDLCVNTLCPNIVGYNRSHHEPKKCSFGHAYQIIHQAYQF